LVLFGERFGCKMGHKLLLSPPMPTPNYIFG
jgi:hypothetical protein